MTTNGPLESWRVLDLTDLRGALCGRMMADLGADVVHADAAPEESVAYRYRHANKRGALIDPTDAGARERWLQWADVVIENFSLEQREGLDLSGHPHLVHVAMADFGLSGPRAGWRLEPLTALAASGTLHASGFPELPPCWMPGHLAFDCASAYAAIGAVAAMWDRRRTGRGQRVEVSVQEAALVATVPWSVTLQDYSKINPFLPVHGRRNADGGYWVLPCADGYIRTVIGNPKQWNGFVDLLGRPDVLAGDEWHVQAHRLINADVVRLVAPEALAGRTRKQLFEEARAIGATVGVVHSPSEFVAHEQTVTRQVFKPSDFPGLAGAPFVQPPVHLSATPSSLRRPAPSPDDDSVPTARELPAPLAETGSSQLPLEGLRVVEFGMAAVVPEVAMALSELGADVIKIESSVHPDVLRASGMGRINCGFAFNTECRGRRSVALNLSTAEGRALALQLCAQADVVAENFRGGVLEEMGLGYESVRALNPKVVYVSSQGYGRSGPLAEMPAYGPLNLGFTGLHGLWNHPDAPYPCGTSLNHPDHVGSRVLAFGVLAALDHRDRTGEGQLVTMAQIDLAAFLLGEVYLEGHLAGVDRVATGNRNPEAAPHDVYPAEGEDRWIAIAVHDDQSWLRLVEVTGIATPAGWETVQGRLADRDAIDKLISSWTSARPAEDATVALQAAGVSAMVVMGPQDHLHDPHLLERQYMVSLVHPEVGDERQPGNPIRLSALLQRTAASAPCLGADTEEVLSEVLGLTGAAVTDLISRGVCI